MALSHCEELLEYYTQVLRQGYIDTSRGKRPLTSNDVSYYTAQIDAVKTAIAEGLTECLGERVLPGDRCTKCGAPLVIYDSAGDEDNTLYIGCPEGKEIDGHTHCRGFPASTLEAWGWKIPAWCTE